MPNLCSNRATIRHRDPVTLRRLLEAYRRGEKCQEFLPVPASVTDGKDWQNYTWGIRTSLCLCSPGSAESRDLSRAMVTPRSPPVELILAGRQLERSFTQSLKGYFYG